MRVILEREKKEVQMDATTVKELLEKLELNPLTVLVAKNGEVVTEKARLGDSDEVRILPVFSGG